ncbi:MAG: TonB-dependent receptor domain-containing protein [Parvibaculum sp.]
MMSFRGTIFTSAIAISTALVAVPAAAQTEQRRGYELEAQDLGSALRSVGRTSNSEIIFETSIVEGKRARPLSGQYTRREAVDALIRGTDLVVLERRGAIIIRERFPTAQAAVSEGTGNSEIVVTGSRIRGGVVTSPLTTLTRQEAERSGQTDLGQLIRDLPQNFSGGQNPTIAGGGQGGFTNVSGSSTLNLRGLGPDASLTLINGHRLAFDAVLQGIDISAIPLAAIERIDIVADGASALYGSDAVAGVANVMLRRDIDAVVTSARLGFATEGGAVTQQYNVVAGPSWSSGGFMAAFDIQRATEITARQRSFTQNLSTDATLIPDQDQVSAVLAGRQDLGDSTTFEVDGHYMHRSTSRCMAFLVSATCYGQGSVVSSTVDNWSLSPSVRLQLSSGWDIRLSGTYSDSDTSVRTSFFARGALTSVATPKYYNKLRSIELGSEGPLLPLPGGEARLALGVGYRSNTLDTDSRRVIGSVETIIDVFSETRTVGYAYGELFLPLLSPGNSAVEKLEFVGALRYEDHRKIDRVTTPKFGLLFSPVKGLDFKANWGKSFKAPTLYQTGQVTNAQLIPAVIFSPAAPSGAPVLYLFGGSRSLQPERATTWNVALSIAPEALKGFSANLTYFRIKYRNRVASPLSPVTAAFDPKFGDFVQLRPSAADVLAAIEGVTGTFSNNSGQAFDPAAVTAILDDRLQNISLQSLHGVDLSANYAEDIGQLGSLSLKASASYLKSNRQVADGQSPIEQAGVVYLPPHWRGRVNAAWDVGNVSLSLTGTFIGRNKDNRRTPITTVGSFTTVDSTVSVRSGTQRGPLANVEWRVGILNLLNQKPAFVGTTDPAGMRFDSTNHSVLGRVVNLTISKSW